MSASRDRSSRSPLRRVAAWSAVGLVLALVFVAYLQPDMAVSLANLVWSCFD